MVKVDKKMKIVYKNMNIFKSISKIYLLGEKIIEILNTLNYNEVV